MTSTIDWTFGGTWPFEPHWYQTEDGRLHYIDEGPRDGHPVVFLHGNPTWGYLYRHLIHPLLTAGFRVIAPDYLGFGRSDKPDDPSLYRIPRHAARIEQLLVSLDLRGATVVPHDWGGPIGMAWAGRHPERIRSLVIFNTIAHRPKEAVELPIPLHLMRAPLIGELLVKGAHAFVRGFMFRAALVHPERLGPDERQAYLAPHPSWSSRTSILVFPREIPAGPDGPVSDFLESVHKGVKLLRSKPTFIAWGMKDLAFAPSILDDYWLADFPDAQVLRLPDAGHYLQEDAHEEILPALLQFLRQAENHPVASERIVLPSTADA